MSDGSHTYAYNGENKIRSVDSQTAYVYNGEDRRVRKLLGENLRFIYGIGGNLIAEFSGSNGALKKEYIYGASGLVATIEPTAINSNGTRYTTPDHLGSPRVLTNSSAGVVSRHDYMPFGEELGAGVGGRTIGMGYIVSDGVRQKFTGYERDSESGLDFAEARYYSSGHGRFTTVDPLMASAVTANPQTFNRYSYVGNSPLTLIDPSGMFGISPGGSSLGGSMPMGDFTQNGQTSEEQQQPPPAQTPPSPAGPYTPGPIMIDVGPAPLPEGQKPWPTTLEVVLSNNTTYNGNPVISPSGVVIDSDPNYGIGKTADIIVRDQAGNPMSEGVRVKETVSPSNPQAAAMMQNVEVNNDLQRPDTNGIVPDTLGAISRDPRVISFLNQNQVSAIFSQNITVYGTFEQQYRTALTTNNYYHLTNAGVRVIIGTVQQQARPK